MGQCRISPSVERRPFRRLFFWKGFPADVRSEGTFDGQTYAVNSGENDSFLYYDKQILKKAGIGLPWAPKTWAQVISAAEAIKKAEPTVSPLFLAAGTDVGTNAILQGGGNLLTAPSRR